MRPAPRAGADDVTVPIPGAGRGREAAGRLFGAVTVLPAMLAAAWLLPALPLLLADRFAGPPMGFMSAPLAAGLCFVAVRRSPARWPGLRPAHQAPAVPWWAVSGTAAVAAAFAAWQIAYRTQQIIYLRDPATYLQVGYWIARHGSLPIPDSLAAFGGPHPGLGFASAGYQPRGSGIVPQLMTGMPLVEGAAVWLGGVRAALLVTPVIGGCAVLSFGGLVGRLAGPGWAPGAAAVLALSLPEQYVSRATFSEPLAELLLFGGLCLLADSLLAGQQAAAGEPGPQPVPAGPGGSAGLAGLAGLTLGLTVLARIDGLSDILPAIPFLGLLVAARRTQAAGFGFCLGLVIGVGYGLADGLLLSRPYLDLEAPSLRPLAAITAIAVVLTAAGVALAASPAVRARARGWLAARPARRLPEAVAVLTVLLFAGFAVRPLVQTVNGQTNPASIAYVAGLQKLAHLPVDGRDQYYQDSLYWVIWYIGVPAVLLGAFGLALVARRCLRAALPRGGDPPQTPPAHGGASRPPVPAGTGVLALPLLVAIWVTVTVLWRPAISPDQPWASRRLVPFVLPGLILGAVWASAWLRERAAGRAGNRAISAAVACCCAAALLIPTALVTIDPGLTPGAHRRLTAHGMAFRRIGTGESAAVRGLCAAIGPDASVVIVDPVTADQFAQVVRGICGTPAAVLSNVTRASVAAVAGGIEHAGRRPVLLAARPAELAGYGLPPPRQVVNLLTTQEPHDLTGPPTATWPIRYAVWMSAAAPGAAAA